MSDGATRTCHLDGDLRDLADVPLAADRGLHFGDAATTTLRAVHGVPVAWDAHHDDLRDACAALSIPGTPPADLRERVTETLAANDLDEADALVRVVVSRGGDPWDPTPTDASATTLVLARERPSVGPATLQTVTTRAPPADYPPNATATRLTAVRARAELVADADEALVRDETGAVVGGADSDCWFVADDALRRPAVDAGVAGRVVRDVAVDEGIPVRTGTYDPADLRDADEAFLTSPAWGVRPVAAVDGIDVGGGPVTRLLDRQFERWIRSATD